jgi:hypothetical protein
MDDERQKVGYFVKIGGCLRRVNFPPGNCAAPLLE